MYDELNAEVGFGLSLIGPHGSLPDDVQRALLALSARPALSRSLYRGRGPRLPRRASAVESRAVEGTVPAGQDRTVVCGADPPRRAGACGPAYTL